MATIVRPRANARRRERKGSGRGEKRNGHYLSTLTIPHLPSSPPNAVRNSWNTNWGNEGYIYLKMGENTCGIADMPAMVTVESPAPNV